LKDNILYNKSIEILENDFWPDSDINEYSTGLEKEIHALRKIPLNQLTPENLRLLMGQNIGNEYTVPLALAILEKYPLFECEMYPGDLLVFTITVESSYWIRHKDLYDRLNRVMSNFGANFDIINSTKDLYDKIDNDTKYEIDEYWKTTSTKYHEALGNS
jgi:hypothetical protein